MTRDQVEAAIRSLEATGSTIDTWVLIFAAVVAIGIVGETVLGVAHWIKDRQLRPLRAAQAQFHETELALLNNETARLRAKALLVDEALLANAEAGRANALASQATATTAEVLAFSQGFVTRERMGDGARSLYIIPKIKPFAGTKFYAVVTSKDLEPAAFLLSLTSALKGAGWVEVERGVVCGGHREQSNVGSTVRVAIYVDSSKVSELWKAAEALASALKTQGIGALASQTSNPENNDAIHILVSPKVP